MLVETINRLENNNMTQTVAAYAAKVTGVSAAGTAGIAATMDVPRLLGYSADEWQIIGIITGIVIGAGGLMTTILFHYLNYRLHLRKVQIGSSGD